MAEQIDVHCEHIEDNDERPAAWYPLGTNRRMIVCQYCDNVIIGIVLQTVINNAVRKATQEGLRRHM